MTVPHPSVAKLTLKSCLTFGGHSRNWIPFPIEPASDTMTTHCGSQSAGPGGRDRGFNHRSIARSWNAK